MLTSTNMSGERGEHQSDRAQSSEGFVKLYNAARSKVSGSVQEFFKHITAKIPSYPDLSAFLNNSPFWIDSPGSDSAKQVHETMQAEAEIYADALNEALSSQPLLMPFIERADRVEVQYATLLADLSNMAYEADKVCWKGERCTPYRI